MIRIESLDDPRLDPYRNLKDRQLRSMGDLFLGEGEYVTRRLIKRHPQDVQSLLVTEDRIQDILPEVPDGVPMYVGSREMLQQIVGFSFHSGILSIGRRPANPSLASIFEQEKSPDRTTILICPEVLNHENMGLLIRVAAGIGAAALIVGESSCDPYWRRSIRVSMGAIFSLPIIRSENLSRDLLTLKDEWNVGLVATVLDDEAMALAHARRSDLPGQGRRVGLLLGSESQGLRQQMIDLCDQKVTIPMHHDTDSLNVAVAAGVFLYHYTSGPGVQHTPSAGPTWLV